MYIMPVSLAWCVACRCHGIEQYAFHANRSICYTCWCVCTCVWECMWILPAVFAFTTVLLRQMLLCDFLADSPALISTHTCSSSSDHSSLPVAGCLPIRSWNSSQFPGDPAVSVSPSSPQEYYQGSTGGSSVYYSDHLPEGPLPGTPSILLAHVPCLSPPADVPKAGSFKVINFGPLCVELVLKYGPVTDEDVEMIHVR